MIELPPPARENGLAREVVGRKSWPREKNDGVSYFSTPLSVTSRNMRNHFVFKGEMVSSHTELGPFCAPQE